MARSTSSWACCASARKPTGNAAPAWSASSAAGELERFLAHGLLGARALDEAERASRRAMARREAAHIIRHMSEEPIGVQIGVVEDTLPNTSFQIFRQSDRSFVAVSPFRLGEQPNVRVGVAMITSAPEALSLHENVADALWRRALKGHQAAGLRAPPSGCRRGLGHGLMNLAGIGKWPATPMSPKRLKTDLPRTFSSLLGIAKIGH